MNPRFQRSRTARSARSTRLAPLSASRGSTSASMTSSRYSVVDSNFHMTSHSMTSPVVPEVFIRSKKAKELTINDYPMMLLPKARIRDNLEYFDQFRRSYGGVVADTSAQGLHISTIQSVSTMDTKRPQKPSIKIRTGSICRSDADSGFCSLKRSVTFDDLNRSQSTVFRSDDEFDTLSESSADEKEHEDLKSRLLHDGSELDDYPEYLDSYGGRDSPITASPPLLPPRPPSRQCRPHKRRQKRRHGDEDDHDADECEICGIVLSDAERVKQKFGKVDTFLDWVMSKWGKDYYDTLRTELQYMPRTSYVYRGHTPHFCNFVKQLTLHSKHDEPEESLGLPESDVEDEVDYIKDSAEGRLIGKYRRVSNASSVPSTASRGLTKSPRLEDYDKDSIPELKEDAVARSSSIASASGTEGRPGSPSSMDGDQRPDLVPPPQPAVTEVRVSSPAKSESSVKSTPRPKPKVNIKPKPKAEEKPKQSSAKSGTDKNKGEKMTKEKPEKANGTDLQILPPEESVVIPRSDSDNDRPPSPREPPPSPEPKKPEPVEQPKPQPPSTPARKKACVTKKTKKNVERTRKMKPIEQPVETPPVQVEIIQPAETTEADTEAVDNSVDLKVPELPNFEKKEKERKEKGKTKRHLIEAEIDDLLKQDASDLLNEQMRMNRQEFDWSNMETNGADEIKRAPQIRSWIQGRLALSQQSSRFELPMDMKNLETMTPQDYIKKHCIITSRRQNLYQKIFMKNKEKTHTINFKDLDKSLKDVLVNTITSEQIHTVFRSLDVDENTRVDYKLFAGMAAYAERVLYPKFVTMEYLHRLIELGLIFDLLGTEDTHDMPEYQREKIECADFCALDWKIHGVNITPQMLNVLKQIC